jgi:hypothetical protein
MQSIFRKIVLAAAFGVAAALAANSALAASRVNVPFSFNVAGTTLPAGSYRVIHDPTSSFVTLQSLQSTQSFTWLLGPGPSESSQKVALRFDDRNGTKVLQAVQFGSKITSRLDKTRTRDRERDFRGQ